MGWIGWGMGVGSLLLVLWFHHRCKSHRRVDWGSPWLNYLDGVNRCFCMRFHRLNYEPLPLPAEGGVVVASNHVSGLDPLLLAAASHRPLRFLIAREQYHRFGLTWLFRAVGCIPVDRSGRPERALREAISRLAEGEVVVVFPHGTIHLDRDPPRALKRGAVRLACRCQVPLAPVRITGVGGEGMVVVAVLLRSHARVRGLPLLNCADFEDEAALNERLGELLQPAAAGPGVEAAT